MSFNEASRGSEAIQGNLEGLRGVPVSFMDIHRLRGTCQKISEELQCVLGRFKGLYRASQAII